MSTDQASTELKSATITITDLADGGNELTIEYGTKYDPKSSAHGLATELAEAVLRSSSTFTQVQDTAPEVDIEPSLIITPSTH